MGGWSGHGPRQRRGGARGLPSGRSAYRLLGLGAVAAVLALAGWSLQAGPAGPISDTGTFPLDGGRVQVDESHSAARPQHAMPGMGSDEDPVAAGRRRVTVGVTLLAGDRPLRYAADRFRLDVHGEQLAPHRAVLPGDALPAGTSLSGALIFDVPVAARTAVLSHAGGGATRLQLPAETAPPAGTAHQHHAGEDGAEPGPTATVPG